MKAASLIQRECANAATQLHHLAVDVDEAKSQFRRAEDAKHLLLKASNLVKQAQAHLYDPL